MYHIITDQYGRTHGINSRNVKVNGEVMKVFRTLASSPGWVQLQVGKTRPSQSIQVPYWWVKCQTGGITTSGCTLMFTDEDL